MWLFENMVPQKFNASAFIFHKKHAITWLGVSFSFSDNQKSYGYCEGHFLWVQRLKGRSRGTSNIRKIGMIVPMIFPYGCGSKWNT
jgi:hypothetical protein